MPPRKSSHDERMQASSLSVVHSGWVLKKKRKKMQGYAKRFLILTKEGLLTYSLSPDKRVRDAIEIPHASVTSSKRHGTIHVDSGSSVFHLKMLSPQDFETWRSQLRSFIPERDPGSAHRIYVASSGETDLVSVDLSGVFDGIATQGRLIEEVQKSVKAIEKKKLDKGMTESLLQMITPPTTIDGLLQKFSLSSDSSKSESPFAALAILVDQLAAEHANLKHAIETKVPKVSGPDGSMDSIKSRLGGNSRSRISISSFQTSEEPSFYDADAAEGEEFLLDDSRGTSSKGEESSWGAEESDEDDSGAEDDGKPIESGGRTTPGPSDSSSLVQYRKQLPAKVSGDEVSLFSMLKKNVGKDLSTISFPVSFNCPLSLLQATCEEFEYAPELLEKAAKSEDWVERICLVGAFAVSGYASTKLRASRKPFNPMLGETFECVREDKHLKFIAEKVVHQPPIVASYAEGKGWSCSSQSSVKNKFWGKSLELIPEGSTRLEFGDGDAFSFQKPSSFMRNLLAGNKYLEHVGELTVTNENTGARLVIEFKEGNMWGGSGSRNQVYGTVYDEHSKEITNVKGKWSENLARQRDSENYQILWEANEMPQRAEDYYGFTYFAMSLNEITRDIEKVIPITDTRLRPDQRAFEEGDVDTAETLKQKLEGEQRVRRKELESKGGKYLPRWFHEEKGDSPSWKYGGSNGDEYFKKREEAKKDPNAWGDLPKVFEYQ